MSSPTGKRDVIRLRTFADDVARAQKDKGVSAPTAAEALVNESPAETKAVFHKVAKKSLNLKDTSAQASTLDSDGVQFDEETVAQVADKAYEEQKSVTEAAKQKPADVEIHQTDTFDTITDQPPVKTTVPESSAPAAIKPTTKFTLKTEETVDQIDAPTASIQSKEHEVHDVSQNDLAGGQIVSDKKRDRFKLFPAIVEATSSWFSETKDHIKESQREKHTVTKTADRVETIKAAAQQKTLAPDEDYDEVAERLRQQKRTTLTETPVVIKPKQEVEAHWTHTVPDDTTNTAEEEVAQSESEPLKFSEAPEIIPEKGDTPTLTEETEATAPVTPKEETVATTPEPIATEPLETPAPITPPEPTALPPTPEYETSVPPPTPAAPKPVGSGFSLPSIPLPNWSNRGERLPSPLLAIIVVVIAIVSGVGTSLYFFWQPGESTVVPAATTNPLFTAQLQTNVNKSATHSETMQSLLATISSSPDTLYLYLTDPATGAVVPPHETMAFLAPQVPGTFARSVTNVSFGSLGTQPFIVLRVNSFDNAFSGMLAWEQTMSADLSPLFGPVVTESFDPQARTDSQTRGAFFRDIVASNLSGRLLTNERGEDRILYTFIDRQTIVISVDRLQLTNILPLVR